MHSNTECVISITVHYWPHTHEINFSSHLNISTKRLEHLVYSVVLLFTRSSSPPVWWRWCGLHSTSFHWRKHQCWLNANTGNLTRSPNPQQLVSDQTLIMSGLVWTQWQSETSRKQDNELEAHVRDLQLQVVFLVFRFLLCHSERCWVQYLYPIVCNQTNLCNYTKTFNYKLHSRLILQYSPIKFKCPQIKKVYFKN